MVCLPCIVIPFFLYIYHRFLQPYVMKFWRLWTGKEMAPVKEGEVLKCPMMQNKTKEQSSPDKSDNLNLSSPSGEPQLAGSPHDKKDD